MLQLALGAPAACLGTSALKRQKALHRAWPMQATADGISQDPRTIGDHLLRNAFEEPIKWREKQRIKVMSNRMLEFTAEVGHRPRCSCRVTMSVPQIFEGPQLLSRNRAGM